MASSLFQPLTGLAQSISKSQLLRNHTVAVGVVAALSAPVLYIAHADYKAWLGLGKAGLPYNAFGWLIQLALTPLRAPRFDTSCYGNARIVAKAGPAGTKAYLSAEDVPERQGRPAIHPWILPHRQADSFASEEWKIRVGKFLSILASNSPAQLKFGTSILERGGPALQIQAQVERHPGARGTRGEIAHLHPLDGSLHVSLAPRDAKLVIEKGWGERFGLSGTVLPVTYIMVYAPRPGAAEEREAEIVERILTAGMKFMLGEQ
ncbi:hypothetical protein OIDMADRAFT_174695 [Oidiodendron maius Zn]|uniref:Luciferase domain-containing protein n=1 Tax=Oidiodendron maius (strain Zn) TaxID=913774 RepID=A0A0C3HHT7_OIDMZ|nr:hypothetical protein OIDMADRAFT_174695 [Oidiodendron maius Zn]